MDEDNIKNRPIPIPKPRQRNIIINNNQLDNNNEKQKYENVKIDLINKNINNNLDDNLHKQINNNNNNNKSLEKIQNNKQFINKINNSGVTYNVPYDEPYRNIITELNNLHEDTKLNKNRDKSEPKQKQPTQAKVNNDLMKPTPAPRRNENNNDDLYDDAGDVEVEDIYENAPDSPDITKKSTGAISKNKNLYTRSAPKVPPSPSQSPLQNKSNNELNLSNSTINSSSSSSSTSNEYISTPSKGYKTTSPGELLKSIGTTSKLLTESISERVSNRTKGAKHKIDKNLKMSREYIDQLRADTSKSASLKLKNVRKRLHHIGVANNIHFSLGRDDKKMPEFNPDRPQTMPPEDDCFKQIKFNSPLNNKTHNFEDLTITESSYEIPKNSKSMSSDLSSCEMASSHRMSTNLPTYEDVVKKSNLSLTDSDSSVSLNTSTNLFERNTQLTQSMVSCVGLAKKANNSSTNLRMQLMRNRSETNIYGNSLIEEEVGDGASSSKKTNNTNQKYSEKPKLSSSSSSSTESLPCPSFPAPVLENKAQESPYGKVKEQNNCSSTESESSKLTPPSRPGRQNRRDYENFSLDTSKHISISSNRATVDSNEYSQLTKDLHAMHDDMDKLPRIFSRLAPHDATPIKPKRNSPPKSKIVDRSESWTFYDNSNDENGSSSPEPVYANEEPVYGMLCEMESSMLTPQPAARKAKRSKSPIIELNLLLPSTSTGITNNISNESVEDILKEFDPLMGNDNLQNVAQKSNTLLLLEDLLGKDTYGTIVDELPLDNQSVDISDEENFNVDDALPTPPERFDSLNEISPVPAKRPLPDRQKSVIIHQNLNLRSDSMENIIDESVIEPYLARVEDHEEPVGIADMTRPLPSRSNWFIQENVDAANFRFVKNPKIDPINRTENTNKNVNKISKSVPQIPLKGENVESGSSKNHLPAEPPSYSEAIGEANNHSTKQACSSKTEEEPPSSPAIGTKSSSMKSMFTNVLSKMENMKISRRGSFKTSTSKTDTRTIIEMIPKPSLSNMFIQYEGHLIRLPSGVVEDILKELHSRKAYLRDRKFQTFMDNAQKQPKESFPLEYITTVQSVNNHKFSNNTVDIHCFEITTAVPKNSQSSQSLSNPNMVMTNNNCGNTKTQRVCHVYGVAKKLERNIWMQKLIESLTDVFPTNFTSEFTRAGWCYLKNSISSEWSGAWVLLWRRKLFFYSSLDMNLESMDLRKARCIVLKECDDSIKNLHIEKGPIMMIDCPPYSIYFIMSSPRETKIWRHIIKEAAHNNGSSLKHQQLTKDNIPVLIDKCINFIYTHGSMSEGIYRKSGAENNIQKLLLLFRTDAFSVQITRTEYNEHDVATALKRFMRDLPERLLGKLSSSFMSISEMEKKNDKIKSYKELLERLPLIEYHTIRKLIGHLNFIQSQKLHNKMSVDNLAMLWGPTLLQDKVGDMQYSQKEADVIADLISLYKNIYHLTVDEIKKEQIMLSVLQKYHAAAENLSDTVKQSGDLKVWIIIDKNPDVKTGDEKIQVNVTLTPTKTAYDVCKELASKMDKQAHQLTLNEIILNDELYRPLHYNEKVLDTVLRWSYWNDSDRKNNHLCIKPTKFLYQVERALKNLPTVTPNSELKYVDNKQKSFKSYTLELSNDLIVILEKKKNLHVKVKELNIHNFIPYLGCEKKRDFQLRWAITLIDINFKKRTRDTPFIGHVIAGTNSNDQIVWYSSILHTLYENDLMPNPEIILA